MNARELSEVARALRTTTEVLAGELANPTAHPPDWSPFDWRIARAAASLHGISALLAHSLRWGGPADWLVFLRDQADHVARRSGRIDALLQSIDQGARAHGLPLLMLKGSALRSFEVYVPGTRPMADVDLLAREEDAPQVRAMIEALGYRERYSSSRHLALEPTDCPAPFAFGEHEANGITVELHTRIAEPLPISEVEVTPHLWPRDTQPGLGGYASPAALMAHLLLHAAGAMALHSVRILHLQDISRLARQLKGADWEELARFAHGPRGLWWAWPPLAFAARYFGGVPQDVLQICAAGCPSLLRRQCERTTVTDVSLSQPWIEALPGLAWSGSPVEMAHYGLRRVVPIRELRQLRKVALKDVVFSSSPWSRLSRARRMLHWAAARQPRVSTLYAVRGALAHPL